MKLAGKVAIVTGAGGAGVGGLGVTYVQALAANGASVVCPTWIARRRNERRLVSSPTAVQP